MIWMMLVLVYGIVKGAREIAKKKALVKNSVLEVLVAYTLLSFLFVVPQVKDAGGMEPRFFIYIAIKSFSIFIAWICSFKSIKKLPVGIYGILDLSRVLFATFLGMIFLGERLSSWQSAGLVFVSGGLLLLKFKPPFLKRLLKFEENNSVNISISNMNIMEESSKSDFSAAVGFKDSAVFFIFLALISCLLNAFSGLMDKILMKDLNSAQLQFWYMLFLSIYYVAYILISRRKISFSVFKNGWVWFLAIIFVIGDKALFIANGMPDSKITVMTLIKQSGCLVTILGGKFVFKEKNTRYRLFCAAVIIFGIVLGVVKG